MKNDYRVILASASPRRKEILSTAGYKFEIVVPEVDESNIHKDKKHEHLMAIAKAKAEKCAEDLEFPKNTMIVGADTMVLVDDNRLGKPADVEDWKNKIRMIAGRDHDVITGVCVWVNGKSETFYSVTSVTISSMTEEEIEEFVAMNEDMDKAGGYAIQGFFSKYVEKINGEYNNVVGFPIAAFNKFIKDME